MSTPRLQNTPTKSRLFPPHAKAVCWSSCHLIYQSGIQLPLVKMISDDDLYSMAIFLGTAAMLLIVLYHFLEINAKDTPGKLAKIDAVPVSQAGSKAGPIR